MGTGFRRQQTTASFKVRRAKYMGHEFLIPMAAARYTFVP
jgi:hypothetical protein